MMCCEGKAHVHCPTCCYTVLNTILYWGNMTSACSAPVQKETELQLLRNVFSKFKKNIQTAYFSWPTVKNLSSYTCVLDVKITWSFKTHHTGDSREQRAFESHVRSIFCLQTVEERWRCISGEKHIQMWHLSYSCHQSDTCQVNEMDKHSDYCLDRQVQYNYYYIGPYYTITQRQGVGKHTLCFWHSSESGATALPHRKVPLETAENTVHTQNTAHGTALHYCWQSSLWEQSRSCTAHRMHWQGH